MTGHVKDLQAACEALISDPKLAPKDGTTYCNIAVTRVCEEYDITCFRGMMANAMCDYMAANWKKVSGKEANTLANEGVICIAGQKEAAHGHVCLIYPGAMVYAGKWKKEVPVAANVGKRNGNMGINWIFQTEPDYYTEP